MLYPLSYRRRRAPTSALLAIVPIASGLRRIGPVPAEIGCGRHCRIGGRAQNRADRNAADDGAVVRPLVPVPIGPDHEFLLLCQFLSLPATLGDLGSAGGGSSPLPRLSYEASKATLCWRGTAQIGALGFWPAGSSDRGKTGNLALPPLRPCYSGVIEPLPRPSMWEPEVGGCRGHKG